MGKSTISMVIFNSYVWHNQAGYLRILPEMAYRIFFSVSHGFTDLYFMVSISMLSWFQRLTINPLTRETLDGQFNTLMFSTF